MTSTGSASENNRPRIWRGVLSALAGAMLWGFSGVCIQFLGDGYGVPASFISLARSLTSGMLFLAFLLATKRRQLMSLVSSASARPILILFGVAIYLSQITYAVSVSLTNAGTATVLQATCAVFVMLYTCLKTRRAPRAFDVLGLVFALAAATLIATQGDWGVIVLPLAGLLWGLANALSETLYLLAPQRLYGRFDRVSIIGCGMIMSAVTAAVVWICGGFWGQSPFVPALDGAGWLALIGGVGFLGTFAAFGLFLYGVSIVGSVRGSLLGVVEPVGAMVVAVLWLAQPFSTADWAGLALMSAMVALVSLSGAKDTNDEENAVSVQEQFK